MRTANTAVSGKDNFQPTHEDGAGQVVPIPAQRPQSTAHPRFAYDRYRPTSPIRGEYSNDGYATDNSPKHDSSSKDPSSEQYQPIALQPAPRGIPVAGSEDAPSEHAYINTSRLHKQHREPALDSPVDVDELKRRQLYGQKRPTRPGPVASRPQLPKHKADQMPPGYGTATRGDSKPSIRARAVPTSADYEVFMNPGYGVAKRDSFSTLDTKSLDSSDGSELSMSKPPLSYRSYDHVRQYSDEKKPFETDIDSMYSEDQTDIAPLYQHRPRAGAYQPSPLVRDTYTGYVSDSSSQQYRSENLSNSQRELAGAGARYGHQPTAETDIDAMSEMTDDWVNQGPPVETDF